MKEKIGLIIGVISAGERKVYLSESAKKWERYYMDPRNYLKKVANNDNSTFVDFICYGDDVALYYINKSIDGRPEDAVFGMITIPSNISISGEKLEDIINQTREELAKTEYDSSKLDELYSTPYEAKPEIKSCTNSIENERFAVQKYDRLPESHQAVLCGLYRGFLQQAPHRLGSFERPRRGPDLPVRLPFRRSAQAAAG